MERGLTPGLCTQDDIDYIVETCATHRPRDGSYISMSAYIHDCLDRREKQQGHDYVLDGVSDSQELTCAAPDCDTFDLGHLFNPLLLEVEQGIVMLAQLMDDSESMIHDLLDTSDVHTAAMLSAGTALIHEEGRQEDKWPTGILTDRTAQDITPVGGRETRPGSATPVVAPVGGLEQPPAGRGSSPVPSASAVVPELDSRTAGRGHGSNTVLSAGVVAPGRGTGASPSTRIPTGPTRRFKARCNHNVSTVQVLDLFMSHMAMFECFQIAAYVIYVSMVRVSMLQVAIDTPTL